MSLISIQARAGRPQLARQGLGATKDNLRLIGRLALWRCIGLIGTIALASPWSLPSALPWLAFSPGYQPVILAAGVFAIAWSAKA